MKKLLSLSLVVLLFAGCDSPTGSSTTSPSSGSSTTSPTVTKEQLLGTWKNTRTYNDNGSTETNITQYTFNADGTFIELSDRFYSDTPETHHYSADKGTYSVDAEGNVTITYTDYAYSIPSFSADGVTWTPFGHPNTYTWPALVIGNQLYEFQFYIAQGSVSGIVGTWAVKGVNKMWNYDTQNYDQKYNKYEIIFNNDGTVIRNIYKSSDGTFGLPESDTGTYTYSNGTLTMTINGTTYINKVTIYNNKYLISGDETSAIAYAYIKQ
jgi:hypothetical protein